MPPRTARPTSQARAVRADMLRADARRNHEQILDAARDMFVERGAGAPLEDIAQRAGVGIGTLYRHFVNRDMLMSEVVLRALNRTTEVAESALAEEAEPFAALARYMHAALELRVPAVIPVLLERVDMNHGAVKAAREASARAVERLLDAAHADGSLPPDVTFGDIGLMLVRLARPLPGPIPGELSDRLAHRHLELLIEGLRPHPGRRAADSGLSLADLRLIGVGTATRAARRRGSA